MSNVISLVFKPQLKPQHTDFIEQFQHWADNHGYDLNFVSHDSSRMIISFGGDGTLIGVFQKLCKNKDADQFPPIYSVHMGTLGFITEFSQDQFFTQLPLALSGEFPIVDIPIYTTKVYRDKKCIYDLSFVNDAVFSKNIISRMVTVLVGTTKQDSLDIEEKIFELSGDGIIISGPLGSTAYSLAAGGPIVHPEVLAFLITPICPHGLIHRPFVLPDHLEILIKVVNSNNNMMLTLDGQQALHLLDGDTIIVSKNNKQKGKLIKNPNRPYFQNIREKFINRGIR